MNQITRECKLQVQSCVASGKRDCRRRARHTIARQLGLTVSQLSVRFPNYDVHHARRIRWKRDGDCNCRVWCNNTDLFLLPAQLNRGGVIREQENMQKSRHCATILANARTTETKEPTDKDMVALAQSLDKGMHFRYTRVRHQVTPVACTTPQLRAGFARYNTLLQKQGDYTRATFKDFANAARSERSLVVKSTRFFKNSNFANGHLRLAVRQHARCKRHEHTLLHGPMPHAPVPHTSLAPIIVVRKGCFYYLVGGKYTLREPPDCCEGYRCLFFDDPV